MPLIYQQEDNIWINTKRRLHINTYNNTNNILTIILLTDMVYINILENYCGSFTNKQAFVIVWHYLTASNNILLFGR